MAIRRGFLNLYRSKPYAREVIKKTTEDILKKDKIDPAQSEYDRMYVLETNKYIAIS